MSILTTGYVCDGEILSRFLNSKAFVRGIRGPVGSGTSSACCAKLFAAACRQNVAPDGLRHTRTAIVRQTNPMLETTTIKTWLDWFPEQEFGRFRWSPPFTHKIRYEDVEWEAVFMPCNTEDDVSRLLSLEISNFWVNEARDVPKEVVDGLTGRLRYPAVKDNGNAAKFGLLDTNAMAPDHWWPIMAGEQPPPDWMAQEDVLTLVKPSNWEFFCQPPAMLEVREEGTDQLIGYRMNPKVENFRNLEPDYYTNMIAGKRRDWIKIYIMNELAMELSGRPIYDQFNEETHSPEGTELEPYPDLPLIVGIDFGLTPAAVIGQRPFGRWRILSEIITQHMGAERLAAKLHEHLSGRYPDWYARRQTMIRYWGDPAGDTESQTDEKTPFHILNNNGIPARPAWTNDFEIRAGAVNKVLMEMSDGLPRFQIDRINCPVTFAAMKGGYQRRRLKTREERYTNEPDKNRYSHPAEAVQYLMLGEGEGRDLLRTRDPDHAPRPGVAGRGESIIARRREHKLGKKTRRFTRRLRGPYQP